MQLENRKENIATHKKFVYRVIKYNMFSIVLISISIWIGCIGYHFIGKTSWLDSFHMACMILTGMGPVVEMKSDAAKLFSSLYALYSGVAFLSITAVFFAPIIHRILHILNIDLDENTK